MLGACQSMKPEPISDSKTYIQIERTDYENGLRGFWLGQSIANWTGLVTEMDKIGGDGPHGEFYTREDWGGPDQPSIWANGEISDISPIIDFVLRGEDEIWGADDDTDIEYMYQHVMYESGKPLLEPEQIRDAWITHIYDETAATPYGPDENGYQNYLWVSNQRAHELMLGGMLPPATSDPENNPHWDMIDAQLTTEIFGLYAPGRPDIALELAHLPIRTTARAGAAHAAEFYVIMHALAAGQPRGAATTEQIMAMADQARTQLPVGSYSAAMYDFIKSEYDNGTKWETARDRLYQRYQVDQADGYDITARGLYCNGCFASGINFGASLISLFWGQGDIKETIKIAALTGWDSDNPAATWGGMLGFMLGQDGVEAAFGQKLSSRFNIHRTRKGFPNGGIDTFDNMASRGAVITERVISQMIKGDVDTEIGTWKIPTRAEPPTTP